MDPVLIVAAIATGAIFLFVTEWVTPDVVALLVLIALAASGVLTAQEAISGFASTATLTVLAMFVLSAAVVRTGVVTLLSNRLHSLGAGREARMIVVIALIVAPISAFMNNTAAVAIMIPLVVALAAEAKRAPSRFLIPLSYASQMGGVLTLIGTSTNILASEISMASGHRPLEMFEFTPVGLVVAAVGIFYLVVIGPRLLPHRGETAESFAPKFRAKIVVKAGSSVVGLLASGKDATLRLGGEVQEVRRKGHRLAPNEATLEPDDIVEVEGVPDRLLHAEAGGAFVPLGQRRHPGLEVDEDRVVVEIVVAPGSSYVGQERDLARLAYMDAHVIGIHRKERMVPIWLKPEVEAGDTLLVLTRKERLEELRDNPDLILVQEVPVIEPRRDRILHVVAIFAGVVGLAALNILPIVVTALAGAVLVVLVGILDMREFYRAVRWDVIVLLAGLVPLGTAIVKTGGAAMLAGAFTGLAGHLPPWILLFATYATTALLTEVLSNNGTVVLMVPVTVTAAFGLGLDPTPFVLAVAFAASTSFMTPVGYQTNTMVYGPGDYKFSDFFRVGAPLNLALAFVTTAALATTYGLW
ncbi:MAG TPA: SLC13 family permease [Candidatus Thermoplasmatota archaeon]|nr:SLC13 family permease [Candidatus Thermoplasmatota archaeon]